MKRVISLSRILFQDACQGVPILESFHVTYRMHPAEYVDERQAPQITVYVARVDKHHVPRDRGYAEGQRGYVGQVLETEHEDTDWDAHKTRRDLTDVQLSEHFHAVQMLQEINQEVYGNDQFVGEYERGPYEEDPIQRDRVKIIDDLLLHRTVGVCGTGSSAIRWSGTMKYSEQDHVDDVDPHQRLEHAST